MSTPASASQGSVALPPGSAGQSLPARPAWLRRTQAWSGPQLSAKWGWLGLTLLMAGVVGVLSLSTAGASALVPRSIQAYPGWEAGPVGWLFGHPGLSSPHMLRFYSVLLVVMIVAYGLVLMAARSLSLRTIAIAAVVINVLLFLGPPLQLTDLFNYLGYARLGALHGLNPYTHVISGESFDPVFRFTTWNNLPSPYGPLFTALTYPLAFLPLPVAFWALKGIMIGASLGFLWCLYRCAVLLDIDPRPVLVLVVANPVYVFFGVGAFHNDFLMLFPLTGAVALLLARRDRSAGAVLMVAVAIKFTAIILLPFLLMAARPPERRLRVLAGVVIATVPLVLMSLALFGTSLPNLAQQSSVVTGYSIPNLIGLAAGLGGRTPMLMRVIDVVLVLIVLWQLRRRDWLAGAGWATIALIASSSWLMPWYALWVLPFAALARSRWLRRVAIVLSLLVMLTFVPEWGILLNKVGFNPMHSSVDKAALAYQAKLAH